MPSTHVTVYERTNRGSNVWTDLSLIFGYQEVKLRSQPSSVQFFPPPLAGFEFNVIALWDLFFPVEALSAVLLGKLLQYNFPLPREMAKQHDNIRAAKVV